MRKPQRVLGFVLLSFLLCARTPQAAPVLRLPAQKGTHEEIRTRHGPPPRFELAVVRATEEDGGKAKKAGEDSSREEASVKEAEKANEAKGRDGKPASSGDGKGGGTAERKAANNLGNAKAQQTEPPEKADRDKGKTSGSSTDSSEGKDGEKETGGSKGSDEEGDGGNESDDVKDTSTLTATEMIAEARAHSSRFMKGGFIQYVEWLFVFILVAPGTFPAIGCVILSCTSFWRRRLVGGSGGTESPSLLTSSSARSGNNSLPSYPRVPHGEHGALVARTRVKGTFDERDSDVS